MIRWMYCDLQSLPLLSHHHTPRPCQAHLGSGDSSALLRGCHRCLSWGLNCPSWRCGHICSCSPHWKTSSCCSLESLTVALHPYQPVLFHCSITSVLWCAASASGSGEFLRVGRHREKCWGISSVYCFFFCKKQHKYRGANLWKFQQLFFKRKLSINLNGNHWPKPQICIFLAVQ